ncbi:NAD-P-binding protein [Mycena galericulata]|nr:NAD-P-binding protein [Mycena galericulata]
MSHGVVLISGITGFVATDTALAFLEAGYRVKATARTVAKAEGWISKFPQHKERYEYVIVPDMVLPGAFDDAVKGCDFIAHVASPVQAQPKDNEADVLFPAIHGTRNLLSATKNEPRIQRVVFTSSLAALLEPTINGDKIIVETEWNPVTYDEAKASTNGSFVYRASKALAERVFWDYIKDAKPAWAGTTICPCGTFAPPLQPLVSLSGLNPSIRVIWNLVNGTYKAGFPKLGTPFYVDGRDVALAHVRAIQLDVAKGQRYLLIGGSYVPDQFVEVIYRHFPQVRDNLPPFDLSTVGDRSASNYDATKVQRELGIKFKPFETTIVDTVSTILALQDTLN